MFAGKKVLVLGLMRSGIAVSELLLQHGAELILCDQKDTQNIRDNIKKLNLDKCTVHIGEDPLPLLDDADILLISPGVPIDAPIVIRAKELGIEVTGELEIAARLSNHVLLAVTGTNGKTTSVTLLGNILENHGRIAWVAGNVGFPLSSAVKRAKKDDVLVCEVSSFQLETTSSFHPAVAALLNITEDHLNRHHTMEEYIRLKFKIFEKQSKFDVAVLNYDDALIRKYKPDLKAKIMWFSRKEEVKEGAFVRNDGLYVRFQGQEHYICNIHKIKIPGTHNLENAMAMACMAIAINVKPQVIGHTLHRFLGVKHRIENVRTLDGVSYINDSKGTNPDSTLKAIQAMTGPTNLILGGYHKDGDFTPLCMEIIHSPTIRNVILLGETAPLFEGIFKKLSYNSVVRAKSMEDAVCKARDLAKDGFTVLLSPACASFDMYESFEHRGDHFREIVTNLK